MDEPVFNGQEIPEESRPPFWKSAMTYGIYYAIVSIILTAIIYAGGLMTSPAVTYISIGVMVIVMIFLQLHYRKSLGGFVTYGQSLAIAVASMFFASILIAVFTYILYKFIDPGLIEQMKLMTEEKLVEQGKLSQEQIDAAMAFSGKFQTPGLISLMQLINLPLTGLIIGAITSIFIKKESPDKIFE